MSNKPILDDFRRAVRILRQIENEKQYDALKKVIELAASTAGYTADQMLPPKREPKQGYSTTRRTGYPTPARDRL